MYVTFVKDPAQVSLWDPYGGRNENTSNVDSVRPSCLQLWCKARPSP